MLVVHHLLLYLLVKNCFVLWRKIGKVRVLASVRNVIWHQVLSRNSWHLLRPTLERGCPSRYIWKCGRLVWTEDRGTTALNLQYLLNPIVQLLLLLHKNIVSCFCRVCATQNNTLYFFRMTVFVFFSFLMGVCFSVLVWVESSALCSFTTWETRDPFLGEVF